MKDYMLIANSLPMWIIALVVALVVVIESVVYIKLSYKNAPLVGLSREDCNRSLKSGLISSIGPSIAVFIVVVSMISVIGAPMSLMRLAIIGAAQTELTGATVGAEAVGSTLGGEGYNLYAMSASWWTMTINTCGWMIFITIFGHKLDKVTDVIGKGDAKWMVFLTGAATLGLFGYMCTPYIIKLGGELAATIAGFVIMIILVKLSDKYNWLKEYALGFAIIAGIIAGSIIV